MVHDFLGFIEKIRFKKKLKSFGLEIFLSKCYQTTTKNEMIDQKRLPDIGIYRLTNRNQ